MLELVARGVSLGFSAGAMPGPFQGYLIGATLAGGWRRSLILILTPLLSDGPVILLMVILLRQFPAEWIRAIQIAGGLYLLWLVWSLWQRLRSGTGLISAGSGQGRTLRQSVLLNWLNPNPYIFWGTISGPLLLGALKDSALHAGAFLLAFYGAFLGLLAGYVFAFDRLRRLDEKIVRSLFVASLLVLLLFGLSLLLQGVGSGS